MDPVTVSLIASFTLKLINEFKSSGLVLTEEEIAARFNSHYAAALAKNTRLQAETAPGK